MAERRFGQRTTWFTADTHFGHNIIKYSGRPFGSFEAMDEALIGKWNDVVGEGDDVFHLGDFAFWRGKQIERYRCRLKGRIHLIWGNHDTDKVRGADLWASSVPYAEVVVGSAFVVLFHYGMRVWNKSHHGAVHLFGHSHGSLPGDSGSVDVGVDYPAWDYAPVRLDAVQRHLATLPVREPPGHHGGVRS